MKTPDPMKTPRIYTLMHPIELKDGDEVLRRVREVRILRRPTFGDLMKVDRYEGLEAEKAGIAVLTDLEAALVESLDLQDFFRLQEIIAPFFVHKPTSAATESRATSSDAV